jgi:hypothetical protein
MNPQFENFGESDRNISISEDFKQGLRKKAKFSIEQLVEERVEYYFRSRVSRGDLDRVADQVFRELIEGKSEEEVSQEIRKTAHELVNQSFKSLKRQLLLATESATAGNESQQGESSPKPVPPAANPTPSDSRLTSQKHLREVTPSVHNAM